MLDQPMAALCAGEYGNPFALLGPHDGLVRILLPHAVAVKLRDESGKTIACAKHVAGGLWEASLPHPQKYILRIDWGGLIEETEDPYSFGLLLSDLDLYLLAEGRHRELATCLGALPIEVDGVSGVRFALWAPNARRVSVVGGFNGWDGRRHAMRRRDSGIWEIFIPRLKVGEFYKYEILGPNGLLPWKADPMARQTEAPPATASVVAQSLTPVKARVRAQGEAPMCIYEVHAPSWMRHLDGRSYSWDELAERLVPYAAELGFTHIELLPVMAHPFGGSWGYQPLSQFAPMPSMGPPEAFARFVSACHDAGLGVILDWVPAHFPSDPHGLAMFDGTHLYEHQDPREGYHHDWNTLIYNLGRTEVKQFLIASALFWLEQYGVDGLRVDAVASMLYRDYSREEGQWIPNVHGGRENLEAIAFLRELSETVMARCPSALLIAEESTAWPGVSAPVYHGGLGFTHKWNMGWMHDTLKYMQTDPVHRAWHHNLMTFGLVYAFSERFVLPISHDEVVHGKGSLIGRMPGDDWQRFASLRAYLAFMWAHPGKKLLFMGCEFGQPAEWNHDAELNWGLLQYGPHRGAQSLLRSLNEVLRGTPALYARDFSPDGFSWVVGDDAGQSVFVFLRHGAEGDKRVLVVCNFTPVPRHGYRIGVPSGEWKEILNTDAAIFGGSGVGNMGGATAEPQPAHGHQQSLCLTLPPLGVLYLQEV
ncbi:MAG: 1,4-alpha-glucan branching protein GlgB [Rhodospirillales bacterium]|nr:1,4-alpha-glucan branching protein GlgB [Rhodospirillales bacterium]